MSKKKNTKKKIYIKKKKPQAVRTRYAHQSRGPPGDPVGVHRSGSPGLTLEAVLGPHPEGSKPLDLERPTLQPDCRAPTVSGAVAPLAPPPTRLERLNGLASLSGVDLIFPPRLVD